jgi:AcrR family transcriptional regulator
VTDDDARRPGRPRDERAREAIHAAALELLAKDGYGALTIDAIARRAGVGRQTIYRWWSSKADVVLEALSAEADAAVVATSLRTFLRATFASATRFAPMLTGLMAHAQLDPAFHDRFVAEFIERRRTALAEHIEAELPGLDPALAADVVFGALWYRLLTRSPAVPAGYSDTILRALQGLATQHAGGRGSTP